MLLGGRLHFIFCLKSAADGQASAQQCIIADAAKILQIMETAAKVHRSGWLMLDAFMGWLMQGHTI